MICNKAMTIREALEKGCRYPFAYIRRLSGVSLGKTPSQLDVEELIEVRFFGPEGEIRVFRIGDSLKQVAIQETQEDVYCDTAYEIENRRFGQNLTVRQILEADDDGQYHVKISRLLDWREN